MKNHTKIIQFLLEHQEIPWTIRAISKNLKINYKIVYEEVQKLAKENIITINKLGNSNQCTFNYVFNEKTLAAEEEIKKSLLKNLNLRLIDTLVSENSNIFFICLVFGSYAKKKADLHSDIDICLIADDPKIPEQIAQILRTTSLKTHLLDFTAAEFLSMLKTRELNVGQEIKKYRIILKGVEDFYNLINHAGSR